MKIKQILSKIPKDLIPVVVWSAIAIPFVTLSGILVGFNRETTWAYVAVTIINVALFSYKKFKKTRNSANKGEY